MLKKAKIVLSDSDYFLNSYMSKLGFITHLADYVLAVKGFFNNDTICIIYFTIWEWSDW